MSRVFPLMELCGRHMEQARGASDQRSSASLHEGHDCVLRQTVTALAAGATMELVHPPDEAWVLVIDGRVTVASGSPATAGQQAGTGDLVQLPPSSHVIVADEDSVFLLTVAKGER